jgi:PAS domain S-box-containing protein
MPVPAPDYELGQFFDLSRDLVCIAERVLGFSGEELMSRPFLEFVHPDDVERARDAFVHLATGEDIIGFECRLVCVDGSVRRFEWNTRTLPHLGVLYGIARDVTVRSALAEEQVALRRMATMVAEAAPPAEIFSSVSNEVAAIFHTELVVVGKFDGDPPELLVVGVGDGADEPVVGSRWKLDDALASTAVYRTGLPARLDHSGAGADLDVAAILERIHPVATVAATS